MKQVIPTLLLENIHPGATLRLEEAHFQVKNDKAAWSDEALLKGLEGVTTLGIRSKTHISKKVLSSAKSLQVIGAFCIGTNQIDLEAANRRGIPVFNAPYSNTRSVAELVLAELVILSRQLGDRSMAAHQGGWIKSAAGSREVRGKTLGIVGYGHIGSQVSVLAEALGLRVIFFDILKKLPLGNARSMRNLGEVLRESDFVTLHVPETPLTKNLISESELKSMKKGSYLINASRGTVVDIPALAKAIKSAHIAGAAVDVFPEEPESNDQKFKSELQGVPNVILTPHIGGSTEEAQEAIGQEVSYSLIRFIRQGTTTGAVNFPQVEVPPLVEGVRLVNVHKNVPGVLGEINGLVSEKGANIKAQYLSTDAHIGYLVMDLEVAQADDLAKRIDALDTTIQTRIIRK